MPDTFPAPWKAVRVKECFRVEDATGFVICRLYFDDRQSIGTDLERMTEDQARRIASNIAKLPQLLQETK